jgi:peptidyl-prolyl cis-trans isomerase C
VKLKWPTSGPWELLARLAVAALVPVMVVAVAVVVAVRVTELPEGVALRVGHTEVTDQELNQRIDAFEALYGIEAPTANPARDAFTRDMAKTVAMSIVVEQAADARGIFISDQAAQDAVNQMIGQRFGPNGHDQFVTLLGQIGASMRDVTDEIKRQQSFAQLYTQVTSQVPEATEAQARAVYDSQRARMVLPERRRLSNIVVSSRDEASQVLQKLRSGADFATIAKQESLDDSTASSGGDLGFVKREQLEPQYADAAFGAPAGSLFGPVQTKSGWNIGQVIQVHQATPVAFEQIQEDLRDQLRTGVQTRVWDDWFATQVRQAHLEYAGKYQPAGPYGAPRVAGADQPLLRSTAPH